MKCRRLVVYEKQPFCDFYGLRHEPVEPFKKHVIIRPQASRYKKMTYMFHTPFSGRFMQVFTVIGIGEE